MYLLFHNFFPQCLLYGEKESDLKIVYWSISAYISLKLKLEAAKCQEKQNMPNSLLAFLLFWKETTDILFVLTFKKKEVYKPFTLQFSSAATVSRKESDEIDKYSKD